MTIKKKKKIHHLIRSLHMDNVDKRYTSKQAGHFFLPLICSL